MTSISLRAASLAVSLGAVSLGLLGSCASPGGGPVPIDMSGADGGDTNGNSCTPGGTRSCICLGGGNGTQTCRDSGTSYGACSGCSNDGGTLAFSDAGGGNPCGDCQGCCDGTACIAFAEQTNTHCGATGTTCTSCSGQTCNMADGTCLAGGSGSCTGCTGGCCGTLNGSPHCFVDTASACGSGGGTCSVCTAGTLCKSGSCDDALDPSHLFKVTISTAQVYNTDGAGTCWDNNGFGFGCGQPDLIVCFAYDPGGGYLTGCTTKRDNVPVDNGKTETDNAATDSTSWTGTDGVLKDANGAVLLFPGAAFINGKVLAYVEDYDTFNANDIIGSAFIKGSTYFSGYMIGPWGREVTITFAIQ